MNENTNATLVRDYLKGRLSAPEKALFEQNLAQDTALQRELALQQMEIEAAEQLIAQETRQLFAASAKAQKTFPFRPLGLLLLLGLAIMAGIFWWPRPPLSPAHSPAPTPMPAPVVQAPETTSPAPPPAPRPYAQLAQKAFKEPVLSGFRSGGAQEGVTPLQEAKSAFTKGKYARTLELLAKTDPDQQQSADFLAGCALFHLKRFEEAAGKFSGLIAANSRQFKLQSEWSLLLCRYAQYPKFRQETIQQLNAIRTHPDHPYFEPAKSLREALPDH